MNKLSVSIVGGAGYAAGELIRILLSHEAVELTSVQSSSQAGKSLTSIHADLVGETALVFSEEVELNADVIFLCSGHGSARTFMKENTVPEQTLIIDIGNDFRLDDGTHNFIYGLPEAFRQQIADARTNVKNIANPGCFATAIQLGLLPLAATGHLTHSVHTTAITGSTGAGQSFSLTNHFSWRQNNAQIYKPFTHQHNSEILQTLTALQQVPPAAFHFLPIRGSFTRGILAASYTTTDMSLPTLQNLYQEYYAGHPFVHLVDSEPAVKQVVNTNKALLHLHLHEGTVLITSVIDNMVKGAAGQAVQNMNIALGLPETAGLTLKPVAF